jgi:hypothetical protein
VGLIAIIIISFYTCCGAYKENCCMLGSVVQVIVGPIAVIIISIYGCCGAYIQDKPLHVRHREIRSQLLVPTVPSL